MTDQNIVGKYSASTIMLESNLPTRILQTKLTPNLADFTDAMKDELDYSFKTDFPECEGVFHCSSVWSYA